MNPFDKHQSPEHIAKRVAARKAKGWWKNPEEISAKMSKAATSNPGLNGSSNPMWKGGLSKLPQGYRNSPEYKTWRLAVMERDNYTCQKCASTVNIIAHHKISWHENKLLRTDVSNGVALCRRCHAIEEKLFKNIYHGEFPNNPSITNIICKYCGKTKSVKTKDKNNYSTCGSKECIKQRIIDSMKDVSRVGEDNGNFRHGYYTNETKNCLVCNKEFYGLHKNKYCSPECSTKGRSTTRTTLNCKICGKEFIGQPYNKFCSRICYYKSRTG